MSDSQKRRARPKRGTKSAAATIEKLSADPEIAALLNFKPMQIEARANGWDAEAQRAFIAMLASCGSKRRAAEDISRDQARVRQLLGRPDAKSFAEAVNGAIALHRRRRSGQLAHTVAAAHRDDPNVEAPGQALNEFGEWEDKESLARRGEGAAGRIAERLLRIRRLYLSEISDSPVKRAAFEILTELPIDWDKATRGEQQPDKPYRNSNQREPDMVLLADSGWSFGEIGYGPDRKAELLQVINQWRVEDGLEPVE